MRGSSSGRRPFKKGKKKNKKKKNKKVQLHAGTSAQGQTKKCKPDQSQAECFCKKQGHWKKNCPLYIASLDPNRPKKKQGTYMIIPCNFSFVILLPGYWIPEALIIFAIRCRVCRSVGDLMKARGS